MKKIQVLIADDHPVFRFGLRALLTTEADMEVVGEAASGAEVVSLASQYNPDVILMDINMPGLNGIDATRRITAAHPEIGVLIFTMQDDDSVVAAMQAGARGYLLKGSEGEVTLRAIRAVASGQTIFSPSAAERMVHHLSASRGPDVEALFPQLTARERDVLVLLAQGLTNKAIAERLFLSPKTVRNQVSEIYSKLQVSGREEAIIRARAAGLGKK